MIGTLDVKINAAHPNLPLTPFYTFVSSPSSVRVTNVPKKIGSWEITKVFVTANYPDNTSRSAECVNVAGCYVATLPLCNVVGESVNGFQITANGVDENGNAVTGYVLGHGDLIVLTRAGNITVGTTTWYFNFKDTQPTNPVKGDACIIGGSLKWYNGTAWVDFGGLNLSDITLDLNADQATINEKLGEVIRRAGGTVIGCLLLCAAPLAAWCAHEYPTNPDPTHKAFFGQMTRDSLVVTNAPEVVESDPVFTAWKGTNTYVKTEADPTVYSKITNSVQSGYLAQPSVTNGLDSSTFVPWVTDCDGNKTAVTIGSRSGAVGRRSLLNGEWCEASGQNSHAEGCFTTANNNASHAEGTETIASGFVSHAEGCFTEANAAGSHSDGWGSKASHISSYVWGGYEGDMPYAEAPSEYYVSHGAGTFNLNPVGGLLGFYVGETNMSQHIATATADKITAVDATNLVTSVASKKQDKLTAGEGIEIAQMTNGNYRWSGIEKEGPYDVASVLYTTNTTGTYRDAFLDEKCTQRYYLDGYYPNDPICILQTGGDYRVFGIAGGDTYGYVHGEEGIPVTNLVIASTISTNGFITAQTATNIVRSVNGGLWDADIGVWWTPVMSNGKLTYQATTNVNLNAGN